MLDQFIDIQRVTTTKDASGAEQRAFTTLLKTYAAKHEKRTSLGVVDGKEVSSTYTVFKVRFDPNNKPLQNMRVVHEGYIYDVEGVRDLGRHHMVEIMTKRRF